MKTTLLNILLCCTTITVYSQQLHLASWAGYNRTAYDLAELNSTQSFFSYGARVAVGLERFQIGAEFEKHLTNPGFEFNDANNNPYLKEEFSNTYYGGLIRFNTAKVPAYRLGLVFKAGAGIYETHKDVFLLPGNTFSETITYPDKYLGFNAGVGISAPIYRYFHWELHYQFNYSNRPELDNIPSYNALHHSLHLGLSLNFVFGEAAKRSRRVLDSQN